MSIDLHYRARVPRAHGLNDGTAAIRPPDVPSRFCVAVLSNEFYYGDGFPHWHQGRDHRPCQTAAEAKANRKKVVKRLRRFGKAIAAAMALADRIDGCEVGRRCMSGACPECARAWQRWFVVETAMFLKENTGSQGGRSTVFCPIHADGIVAPGGLVK